MADAEAPLLSIRGLNKSYALGDQSVPVLTGLDLEARAGELLAVMGPSGAGKTTLLNCVAGIDTGDTGGIHLGGTELGALKERERTRLRRDRIGMVFQFFNLVPSLTVRENIGLPFRIRGAMAEKDHERVEFMLQRVGLAGRADHLPFQLSGGEMQLASIARALVHGPMLLLADEPTGNVNPAVGIKIMQLLRELCAEEGTGVLMVTHSPEHAAWSDRIGFLKDGCIVDVMPQAGREHEVAPIYERLAHLGI
ncbi:MAG: ABC transporter ATP-binding protein [Gammaproteobacteria bacterium]